MSRVLLELDGEEQDTLREQLREVEEHVTVVEARRFDAVTTLQLLATLNAVTIPLLARLITERIRSKRYVVVKKNGRSVSVTGLSADDVVKVLSAIGQSD